MTSVVRAAVVVVVLAASAWAQDAPPATAPRHENKVSAEAKAAIEQYQRLVYRPGDRGLLSLSAALAADGGPPPVWRIDFKPPRSFGFGPTPGARPTPVQSKMSIIQLQAPLRAGLMGMPLWDGDEYDAEVVDRGGVKTLVVTEYHGAAKGSTSEFVFDAAGLLATATPTPDASFHPVVKITWERVGDLNRIVGVEMTAADGAQSMHTKAALSYATVAGVELLTSFTTSFTATERGTTRQVNGTIRLVDVVVNGKSVELPKPKKHENQISPEARAAMDAYAKLVYRPAEHGLVSMSGSIVSEGTTPPQAFHVFEFRAPNAVSIAPAAAAPPDTPGVKAGAAFHRFALLAALDGVRIGETTELDAKFVGEGGARTLQVVEYVAEARSATVEFAVDARGLVTSLRRRGGADPAAPTSDVTIRVTWGKFGTLWRVESADLVSGPPETTTFSHFAFQFATVGGCSVPTSYVRTHVETGKDAKVHAYRVEDLVVNGRKAEMPKAPVDPPTDGGKK